MTSPRSRNRPTNPFWMYNSKCTKWPFGMKVWVRKLAREGVRGAFEYLLKGRKVKLDASQREGFDSKIVADELLMRWSITIVESKEDESTVDMKVQKYTIPYH
ncbi:hypothetical protein ACSBR1_016537 [Camellia fascicularis]